MSQTLLWRSLGPSPLSVCFFSITYLPGLALIVVWTIPKHQVNTRSITKQFILILWLQGRVSAPSPGEGVRISLDQVTQTLSVGTVWKRRGEKNSIPPIDSDWWGECTHSQLALPDWRHWDPVTVTFFSAIWSSTLMNSNQFIYGPNWNFLANWFRSEGKGMGADQDRCLVN